MLMPHTPNDQIEMSTIQTRRRRRKKNICMYNEIFRVIDVVVVVVATRSNRLALLGA